MKLQIVFERWKKRKQESAKAEAVEIGTKHITAINQAIEKWRTEVLELKTKLLLDLFDERLVQMGNTELQFAEEAEIELLAMLKNWIEGQAASLADAATFIDPESWSVAEVLGAQERISEVILETHKAVGLEMADSAVQAINEEAQRRGVEGMPE